MLDAAVGGRPEIAGRGVVGRGILDQLVDILVVSVLPWQVVGLDLARRRAPMRPAVSLRAQGMSGPDLSMMPSMVVTLGRVPGSPSTL